MTKINNDTIQIIEERLQNFWDTYEGEILKKALDEQTKKIKELEKQLKDSQSKEEPLAGEIINCVSGVE